MERPGHTERKTSFNPEATAFSPIATPVKTTDVLSSSPGAFDDEFSRLSVHPGDDSPLSSAKLRANHSNENAETYGPFSMQDLIGAIADTSTNPAPSVIGTSHFQQSLPFHFLGYYPQLSFDEILRLQREPNPQLPDIDELSTGLGLPSAKKDTTPRGTSKAQHRSRLSQDAQSALYGELIDKALNKPLTANALAQYLKSPSSASSDETVRAFPKLEGTPHGKALSTKEQDSQLKVVLPPPGFGNQMPRMVTVEEEEVASQGTSLMEQTIPRLAPHDSCHQITTHTQPASVSGRHRPSTRRRPRGHTRTKRTDQGPEPSAADIYPDDAKWKGGPPLNTNFGARTGFEHLPPTPPREVWRPDDSTSWPTPAEVYTYHPQAPIAAPAHSPQIPSHRPQPTVTQQSYHAPQAPTYTPQPFVQIPQPYQQAPQPLNIFTSHTSPTPSDIHASDADVLTLLSELPDPTITTFMNFGAFDLMLDERELSEDQASGSRYGLRFHGIGLGDAWKPPEVDRDKIGDVQGYKTVWEGKG